MQPADKDKFRDFRDPAWPKGLYRRRGSFRFKKRVEGRSVAEVWGVMSDRDAIDRATQYNLDIRRGKNPVQAEVARRMTFDAFAYEVWLEQKRGELRERSWAKYRSVVDNFSEYLRGQRRMAGCLLEAIDYGVARDYMTFREQAPIFANGTRRFTRPMKGGAAKKTLYIDRSVLHQLFGEAVRRKLVGENPFKDVKRDKPRPDEVRQKHHPLTEQEANALLVAAQAVGSGSDDTGGARFHDVVLFLLNTGMRENEVRLLEWTDIQWDSGVIRVRSKSVTETRTIPITSGAVARLAELAKGKPADAPLFRNAEDIRRSGLRLSIRSEADLLLLKVRDVDPKQATIRFCQTTDWRPKASQGDVPMSKGVRDLLDRLKGEATSNFVFAHHDGGRSRADWLSMLKEAQRLAKIPGNLRIHDLRHTCAFRLRQRGVPLETIMGILRHADIRETLLYAPYDLEEGKRAIMCLDRERTPSASADGQASASSAAPTP